jgi:hypothetical protein
MGLRFIGWLGAMATGVGLILAWRALPSSSLGLWETPILVLAGTLIVAGVAGMVWDVVHLIRRRPPQPPPPQPLQPDPKADADLRRRARQLGQQIAYFAANRRSNDPGSIPHWHGLPVDASEDQKTQAFNRHTQALLGHSTETQNQYNVQFMGPALALFDELEKRGWLDQQQRFRFEHPTNQLGIEEVARTLQRIGEGG